MENQTMDTALHRYTVVQSIEDYISKYVTLPRDYYALPLALWAIATHMYMKFDTTPYLCITAATRQAGKTRLSEVLRMITNRPYMTSGGTGPALFEKFLLTERDIEEGITPPTLFLDEAEDLKPGGSMREFLNSGYRKGQVIPRVGRDYPSYSPKCFVLIGDLKEETLRDRCILVILKRGTPTQRFIWSIAEAEGAALVNLALNTLDMERDKIAALYPTYLGVPFLGDRDAEIWAPLFAICDRLCPRRMQELMRAAVDMSADKTAPVTVYADMAAEEEKVQRDKYSEKLLVDMGAVLKDHRHLEISELLNALMDLPLSPWRRYKGVGLSTAEIAGLVKRFGVRSTAVQKGQGTRSDRQVVRAYKRVDVERAIAKHITKGAQ